MLRWAALFLGELRDGRLSSFEIHLLHNTDPI